MDNTHMPVYLELTDEGRVLKIDIVSPWTLQELTDVFKSAQAYFDNSSRRIDSIADIAKMTSIPAGALRMRNSPFLSHPQSGYQVVVGANTYAKSMAEILFRLANYKRVRFVPTLDEAWAYLHSPEVQAEPDIVGIAE